ncbi:MAG: hypothetical protein J2P21_22820 [Chloracidobacterium sp.]|nr:hypothetical protein [Chloracidobacterium sp.]
MPRVKNEIIKQYLLNALSEVDREQFEMQYFEDDGLYQRLRAIEEKLIADYVYERLADSDRRLFDEHYCVTPGRRKRIENARNWKKAISDPRRKQEPKTLS